MTLGFSVYLWKVKEKVKEAMDVKSQLFQQDDVDVDPAGESSPIFFCRLWWFLTFAMESGSFQYLPMKNGEFP